MATVGIGNQMRLHMETSGILQTVQQILAVMMGYRGKDYPVQEHPKSV
jgi:hypothetical protein